MNICLDTRLLEEIAASNDIQKNWFINVLKNSDNHVFLPSIVISEFVSESLNKRDINQTDSLIDWLCKTNLIILGLNVSIAREAGKLQYQYRFGIGDCIVVATAIYCKSKYIRTDQNEFEKVKGVKTFF